MPIVWKDALALLATPPHLVLPGNLFTMFRQVCGRPGGQGSQLSLEMLMAWVGTMRH